MNDASDTKIKQIQDANATERSFLHKRFSKEKKFKIDDGDPVSIEDMKNRTLILFYRVLIKQGSAKSQIGLVVFEEIRKRNIRIRV